MAQVRWLVAPAVVILALGVMHLAAAEPTGIAIALVLSAVRALLTRLLALVAPILEVRLLRLLG